MFLPLFLSIQGVLTFVFKYTGCSYLCFQYTGCSTLLLTCVKMDEAVDQERQGAHDRGLCQFVATADAIWCSTGCTTVFMIYILTIGWINLSKENQPIRGPCGEQRNYFYSHVLELLVANILVTPWAMRIRDRTYNRENMVHQQVRYITVHHQVRHEL